MIGARGLLGESAAHDGYLPTRPMTPTACARFLPQRRIKAVIPPNPTRKHPHPYDKSAYQGRNLIERMFCRLKDFRRIATRYDKLADNFLSAILFAARYTWWLN